MKGIVGKILTGISITIALILAIGLGVMVSTVIRGESPRQLAEKAQAADTVDNSIQDNTQPEDVPSEPVKPMTVGEVFGVKPQVQPDPQITASTETAPELPEPEPLSESNLEPIPEPEPVPAAPQKATASQNAAARKNTAPAKSTPATVAPASQAQQPVPVETAPAEPVYDFNEAPCMVEGLDDGPSYAPPVQQSQQAVQPLTTSDSQYAPPMVSGLDGDYSDTSSTAPSILPENENQTGNPAGSSGNRSNVGNSDNFYTYDNADQQQTTDQWVLNTSTMKIHYPSCNDVGKIAPQNYSTSNASESDLLNLGYTTCGHCHK